MARARKIERKVTAGDVGRRTEALLAGEARGERMTATERRERGRRDPAWFCSYYLPEHFSAKPAEFHEELDTALNTQARFIGIAPREHAKTTKLMAHFIRCAVYKLRKFMVSIRVNDDIAAQFLNDIRIELETNDRLREDFGDLLGDRKWTELEFELSNGVKFVGAGRLAKIRGLKHREQRPDLVVGDDIEDDESADSVEQTEKIVRWVKKTVLGMVSADGQVFFVGNLLAKRCALAQLAEIESFHYRTWSAIKADGKPIWPAAWSLKRLAAKKIEVSTRVFNTEYMNNPIDEDAQLYNPDWWGWYGDDELDGVKLRVTGAIDPSTGKKKRSTDETAIAVVGSKDGVYYVLYVRMAKLKFRSQVEAVLDTCERWRSIVRFGVETIAYQESLRESLVEVSKERNLQAPIQEIASHDVSKMARFERLSVLAEQGRIRWPKTGSAFWTPDMARCREQFEALGVTETHDDGPDAVEMAISLQRGLQKKGRVRLIDRRAA